MKKTEEKVAPAGREKTDIKSNPNSGKPRQPVRDNKGAPSSNPDFGDRKKVRPQEWQPGTPAEHESHRRTAEDDQDDIEVNETTL